MLTTQTVSNSSAPSGLSDSLHCQQKTCEQTYFFLFRPYGLRHTAPANPIISSVRTLFFTVHKAQSTSNMSSASCLSFSLYRIQQICKCTYFFLFKSYALPHISTPILPNSAPATHLLTVHTPQAACNTSAASVSPLSFVLDCQQQTYTHTYFFLSGLHTCSHTVKIIRRDSPSVTSMLKMYTSQTSSHMSGASGLPFSLPCQQKTRKHTYLFLFTLYALLHTARAIHASS